MDSLTIEEIAENLEIIRNEVGRAAEKAGRKPSACRIMAVTKNHPVEYISMALACKQTLFGENRVQEAAAKYRDFIGTCELHLIGHLQRNKARVAADTFSCVQSIDKIETVRALDAALRALGRKAEVLIEVNTSGESSKFGVAGADECFALLDKVLEIEDVIFRGLMTVGPLSDEEKQIRKAFSSLKGLFEETRSRYGKTSCDVLSMGMSSDYRLAVEEGSTLVRIGTAIFGKRG
jgi:pyridoxal phosphate enzyme (YggS family)